MASSAKVQPKDKDVTSSLLISPEPLCVFWTRTSLRVLDQSGRQVLTMRTSSHRLAAVRKSEAMLLASVNCSSRCLKRGSYLPTESMPVSVAPVCSDRSPTTWTDS